MYSGPTYGAQFRAQSIPEYLYKNHHVFNGRTECGYNGEPHLAFAIFTPDRSKPGKGLWTIGQTVVY